MNTFAVITNSIRRSRELVEKSLQASLAQAGICTVIFVDQNEVPLVLSESLTASSRLKIVHANVPSVSQARNLATYPNADWLIFCDDDGYMQSDYLANLARLIEANPHVDIFCGSIKRTDNGEFYSKRHAVGGNMQHFWNTKLLMGSNFCVRRQTFEDLGKFDENFGAGARYGSSEETDFAWKAYFHSFRMIYVPELVVFHVAPFSGDLASEVEKAYRYGVGKGALVKKWFFLNKKWIVAQELVEMIILPFLRLLYDCLSFDLPRLKINISTLRGRLAGLFSTQG